MIEKVKPRGARLAAAVCFALAVAAVWVLVDAARLPSESWFDR